MDAHSTRVQTNPKGLEEKGLSGAKAAAIAAVATRPGEKTPRSSRTHRRMEEPTKPMASTTRPSTSSSNVRLPARITRRHSAAAQRNLQGRRGAVQPLHGTRLSEGSPVLAPLYGIPFEDLSPSVRTFLTTQARSCRFPSSRPTNYYAAKSVLEMETKLLKQLSSSTSGKVSGQRKEFYGTLKSKSLELNAKQRSAIAM